MVHLDLISQFELAPLRIAPLHNTLSCLAAVQDFVVRRRVPVIAPNVFWRIHFAISPPKSTSWPCWGIQEQAVNLPRACKRPARVQRADAISRVEPTIRNNHSA